MENQTYLMFDLGTSSLKAVLYGEDGQVLHQETVKYEYRTPQAGWVEMDPEDWEKALWQSLERMTASYDLQTVRAMSFTGQMHSLVMLNQEDKPMNPCILWLDRRAHEETAELQADLGLPPYVLNSTYSLPKMYWLSKHHPEMVRETKVVLWPKDFIRFLITGQIATDFTEGLGAGLADWENGTFATERLGHIGWDPKVLPPILEPNAQAGHIKPELAKKYGLNPEAKVFTGYGDILALLGGAPHRKGRLVYSFGSSSMFFTLEDQINKDDSDQRLYRIDLAGHPLYGGVSSTTGAAIAWCHEKIWGEGSLPEMIEQALVVPPGADGLIFLPYLAGERSPYWSDSIRGGFYGMHLEHRKEHMARAVLEGIAFSIRHLISIFTANGVMIDEIALAAGGVKTAGLSQLIADVCGLPVRIFAGQETVTNMIFLMARCTIRGISFQEALADSFGEPTELLPDLTEKKSYNDAFQKYLAFSVFASQQD